MEVGRAGQSTQAASLHTAHAQSLGLCFSLQRAYSPASLSPEPGKTLTPTLGTSHSHISKREVPIVPVLIDFEIEILSIGRWSQADRRAHTQPQRRTGLQLPPAVCGGEYSLMKEPKP